MDDQTQSADQPTDEETTDLQPQRDADVPRTEEEAMDDTSADSFPASDPPGWTSTTATDSAKPF